MRAPSGGSTNFAPSADKVVPFENHSCSLVDVAVESAQVPVEPEIAARHLLNQAKDRREQATDSCSYDHQGTTGS